MAGRNSGPPTAERRPHMESGSSASGLARQLQSTTKSRQKAAATPVIAAAHGVIGGTGRHRWLLVFRCPCCGAHHVAHGRGDLPASLERPAACGRGRLSILPAVSRIGGAA